MAASDAKALELELFGSDSDEDHLVSPHGEHTSQDGQDSGDLDSQEVHNDGEHNNQDVLDAGDLDIPDVQDAGPQSCIRNTWPPAQRIVDGLVLVRHFLAEGDQIHFLGQILAEGMAEKWLSSIIRRYPVALGEF